MVVRCIFLIFCFSQILLGPIPNRIESQLERNADQSRTQPISRSVRTGGWPIPKSVLKPGRSTQTLLISGLTVRVQNLTPAKAIVDYEVYFIYPDNSLGIITAKRRIEAVRAYSIKNKVFAYAIQYTAYLGEGANVTGVTDVLFIDNDGDSQFEERLEASKLRSIPEWIKQL